MGAFAAFWGIGGLTLLLSSAVYRLTPWAIELFSYELHWQHWLALAVNVFFMAYSEGYRGFQQGFSPRVAARAKYLRDNPNPLHTVLAPLFCMGFLHATRKRKIISTALTLGIIILIVLVRMLSQPWRGIVDFGVVLGLTWGIVSMLIFAFKAFTDESFDHSPEVPEAA